MNKKQLVSAIESRMTRILSKMKLKEAEIKKIDPDRVVVNIDAKLPEVRRAFTAQYGRPDHIIDLAKGRRLTWSHDKGSIIIKGSKTTASTRVIFTQVPAILPGKMGSMA